MKRGFAGRQNSLVVLLLLISLSPAGLHAAISGLCSDCHTMHNSQDGQVMADFGGENGPNPALTRGGCLGCHAQGNTKIVTIGSSPTPQVFHNDGSGDLAAGNFAYMTGAKASPGGAADSKGHNVIALVGNADATLPYPPGFRHGETELGVDISWMTCAGVGGCHGLRGQVLSAPGEFEVGETVYRVDMTALSGYEGTGNPFPGAHHDNYDGLKRGKFDPDFSSSPLAHSYRFLHSLIGFGNPSDRWQNTSSTSHNEYLGVPGKTVDFGTTTDCGYCHVAPNGMSSYYSRVAPFFASTTFFCVTCHGDFHASGPAGTSAFRRHPTDFTIKDEGEYAHYTTYDIAAPVARLGTDLSAGPSAVVNPGSDMVMCLSCHMAHASPYPDILRWDYQNDCSAGSVNEDCGCMTCHTTKDD